MVATTQQCSGVADGSFATGATWPVPQCLEDRTITDPHADDQQCGESSLSTTVTLASACAVLLVLVLSMTWRAILKRHVATREPQAPQARRMLELTGRTQSALL